MKNKIPIIESQLEKIMGKDLYAEVKDFYKHVYEIDCTKVIVEGRTYALYKIFENIFEADSKIQKSGRVYTTPCINQIPKGKERILLIIDIIKEGNIMLDYIKQISDFGITNSEQITIWCIRCNSEATFYNQIASRFKHVVYSMPMSWKVISDKLSQAVRCENVGLLSSAISYRFNDLTFSDIAIERYSKCIENTIENCEGFLVKSKVFWGNFFPWGILHGYEIKPCLRVYEKQSDSQTELIVVPYVFLPSLRVDKIYEYCKSLLGILGLEYPKMFDSQNDSVLFYKWTVYAVSKLIFEIFLRDQKEILPAEKLEFDICDCSRELFGVSDEEVFIKAESDDFNGRTAIRYTNPESESHKLFQECYKWRKDFVKALNHYTAIVAKADKKNIRTGINLYQGLSISHILEQCYIDKKAMFSEVIRGLDTEKVTLNIEFNRVNKNVLDAFLRNGTQVHWAFYNELNKNVYGTFYYFFLQTTERRKKQLEDLAMYLDNMLMTREFSDFTVFVDEEEYFSDLMAISPVIEVNDFIKNYVNVFIDKHYNP